MDKTETIEIFYSTILKRPLNEMAGDKSHFDVIPCEEFPPLPKSPSPYSKRDFFKITLLEGHHRYHYAGKSREVKGTSLIFLNPSLTYSFESLSGKHSGFVCVFREPFFSKRIRGGVKYFPMFNPGNNPCFELNTQATSVVRAVYEKMMGELQQDYAYKNDLLIHYTFEILHFILKNYSIESLYSPSDANTRIATEFFELLESQFPIEETGQRFSLRSANDFAKGMSIHVNHLNRSMRMATGKTTTAHISDRLFMEAKSLLKYTRWSIAQVSYCLGFDEQAHFNRFFKRHSGNSPTFFRG